MVALDDLEGADPLRAVRAAQAALAGPTEAMLSEWLAKLAAVVARAERSEAHDRVMELTMREHLADKPLDAVREALSPTRWKFWPSLREVLEVVDALAAKRRAALRAVEALARQSQSERGERWRQEALDAEREAEIAAAHGRPDDAAQAQDRAKAFAARAADFGVAVDLGARRRIAARVSAIAEHQAAQAQAAPAPTDAAEERRPLPRPSQALLDVMRGKAQRQGGW